MYDDTTETSSTLRPNCSVYNPCGSNGHCRHNFDGEWICVCKFWWNGTYCDDMTSSGEQVIIAGALLAFLIFVFYGLKIFYAVRQWRNRSVTKEEINTKLTSSKFSAVTKVKMSRFIVSSTILIFTFLVGSASIIVKYFLIEPIHRGMIERFQTNGSLFFRRHKFCQVFDVTDEFNIIIFPASCGLFLILCLTSKRVSFGRSRCWFKFIGLPIPMDFFFHFKRTFAAVIFAIFADELLEIANEIFTSSGSESDEGIILSYLKQIFKVLVIGFRRYPTLAAIYIDTPLSLTCATVYTWLDFVITIMKTGLCHNDFFPTEKTYVSTSDERVQRYLNHYGTGPNLLLLQLVSDIPRYLLISYICVKLIALLVKRLIHRDKSGLFLTREQKILLESSLPDSIESIYVQNLLRMNFDHRTKSTFFKYCPWIYRWRNDFRFSTRIVCLYSAIGLLLFFITVQALVRISPTLALQQPSIQNFVDAAVMMILTEPEVNTLEEVKTFRLPDLVPIYVCAVFFTLLVVSIQLMVMLASIRRNLLQAYRADYKEIPSPRISSHSSYVEGNFSFAGSLIGYIILGYVFLAFFSFIFAVVAGTLIKYGTSRLMEKILKWTLPSVIMLLLKMYLNKILCQYVFLHHKLRILSLNNRRVFMVFLYFNIFLDAFLGIVSAIIRILQSVFGGLLYMSRLDYSPLGRKLETFDAGFSAYCGFIHVECAHRHPVLLCFISHLLRGHIYADRKKRWSRARQKWSLAVFLLNNPNLIYQRKRFRGFLFDNQTIMALVMKTDENSLKS